MKKVCHLTSVHPAYDTRIFHKECSSLAKAGFKVILIAPNCTTTTKNDVEIINVSYTSTNRIIRILFYTQKVYKVAKETNADIYHIHDPELLPIAVKLKRKGKTVIYDVHEDVPKQILNKYWINKYLRKAISKLFKKYENYVAKRVDYVIAAEPPVCERFKDITPNCVTVQNYPLLHEIKEDISWLEKKNEICYIGGLTKERGLLKLIQTLNHFKHIKLHLAGNYSPLEFELHLKNMPGWKNVTNHGFVERTEIQQILSDSKIGMVTLLPIPNYIESYPIKMFEYMSAGIPVIASEFPLWKTIIEESKCGICVNPNEPTEIANAINYLLSNDELARKMGENGRKAILAKYNWSIEEEKFISVYNQL